MNQFDRERFEKAKAERDKEWNQMLEWSQKHKGKKVIIRRKDHPWNGYKGTWKGIDMTETGAAIEIRLGMFRSCYVFSTLDLEFVEHE